MSRPLIYNTLVNAVMPADGRVHLGEGGWLHLAYTESIRLLEVCTSEQGRLQTREVISITYPTRKGLGCTTEGRDTQVLYHI
jgi:hypothetical protein